MNTTSLGSEAEQLVCNYLKAHGYKILDTNWRRQSCEIDVIGQKDSVIYLVEVKFRKRPDHGGGFDHITTTKLKQMTYAAHVWATENDWTGDYRLMAAAVDYDGARMTLADIQEVIK